ncbi:MAG: TRAP transporter large permease [Deltaproteobacteria bacterium]|nr:TRAP transporter large permease [Deltaproteobacteria bacterium]
MDLVTIGFLSIVIVVALVIIGIPIAYSMIIASIFVILFGLQQPSTLLKLGTTPFATLYNMTWVPLPLFILMAYIISETEISSNVFDSANKWLSRIPGGLVVSGIVGEAAMAAAIGSSGVTMLAVGKIALPEMEKLNYKRNFSLGALLAGGVLGPLIPPSIPFIVYGIIARVDIGKLLIAGVIPGVVLVILLSLLTIVNCKIHPEWAPLPPRFSWKEKFISLKNIWAVLVIMIAIIGSIYLGIATAAEASGVGVVTTLIVAVVSYNFRYRNLKKAVSETATLTGMIGLMVLAATIYSFAVGVSGLAKYIAAFIVDAGLSPWMVIIAINFVLLLAGFVMDTLAITLVTVPIFVPLIVALGFDPIWFGVVMVINTEIGLITPPIGLNTFIASSAFHMPIGEILRGVFPYLIILFIFLIVIVAFPELSLWLPRLMM